MYTSSYIATIAPFQMEGVEGVAEFATALDTNIRMYFWYALEDGSVKYGTVDIPHEQPEPPENDAAIPDKYIFAALDILPKMQPGSETFFREHKGQEYYYFLIDLGSLPHVPWSSRPPLTFLNQEFELTLRRVFRFPLRSQDTEEYRKAIAEAESFLASKKVQLYLLRKATEMADFWVSHLGEPKEPCGVLSGDITASLGTRRSNRGLDRDQINLFRDAVIQESLEQLNKGHHLYPFSTRYAPVGALDSAIQRIADPFIQNRLSMALPWSTSKKFDFSDSEILKSN